MLKVKTFRRRDRGHEGPVVIGQLGRVDHRRSRRHAFCRSRQAAPGAPVCTIQEAGTDAGRAGVQPQ